MTPESWSPISSAPRDGTEVELMDEADGLTWRMSWRGSVWVMQSKLSGALLAKWPEGAAGPTHWRTVRA